MDRGNTWAGSTIIVGGGGRRGMRQWVCDTGQGKKEERREKKRWDTQCQVAYSLRPMCPVHVTSHPGRHVHLHLGRHAEAERLETGVAKNLTHTKNQKNQNLDRKG